MKVIDLSGYMFSGKSAISDILREFNGVHVPNYLEEFDLLRMPGGLIDLKNAVMDWSPVRTYAAINRFDKLVDTLALSPKFPQKLFKTGYGYNKRYPSILQLKDQFLNSIMALQWQTPWPYADIDDGPIETFSRKALGKLSVIKTRKYFLVDREKFMPAAVKFIQGLLAVEVNIQPNIFVTHNALEPFSPGNNIDLLGNNALCIVVDRDPRDIYATAISSHVGFNENVNFNSRIAGAHNIDVFITRYLIYRRNIDDTNDRVLRLNFQDLILDYDNSLKKICKFTGIPLGDQVQKKLHFNPEKSKKNLNIWKREELERYIDDFNRIAIECSA